jgi:hypothetical protein
VTLFFGLPSPDGRFCYRNVGHPLPIDRRPRIRRPTPAARWSRTDRSHEQGVIALDAGDVAVTMTALPKRSALTKSSSEEQRLPR